MTKHKHGHGHGHRHGSAHRPSLGEIDLSGRLNESAYEARLAELQHEIARIQHAYLDTGDWGVVVFEGWDAAGKGGTIRRISAALDPRSFKVWPIGAPREYYHERHWLLRFMERLPPRGGIAIFDRSWYGRVLVERVEGLTPERRWRAAYREIVEFERMLIEDGARIAKVFFHISAEEQLERLHARLLDPMKRWKLSYEDFRNRARRADYLLAIDEMLARCSTEEAPWAVVPSEQKKFGRIAAMEEIVRRLSAGVDLRPRTIAPEVLEAAEREMDLSEALVAELGGGRRRH